MAQEDEDNTVRTITTGWLLGWIWAVFAGVGGIGILAEDDALAGILTLLSALLALPPFGKFLRESAQIALSGWLKVLIILGLLIGAGLRIEGHPRHSSDQSADTSSSSDGEAPLQVSSINLSQAYSANEVAAQKTYGGHVLDVSGTVTGITLDIVDAPVIQLAGVNMFLPVQARFSGQYSDQISNLTKGQQITVRCSSVTEVISEPMLSDCSFP